MARSKPERVHPTPGLLDAWDPASFPSEDREAGKVPVLGPLRAAQNIPPGHEGRAVWAQRWSAPSALTPSRATGAQMACRHPASSWVSKDAGPEQAGGGSHRRVLHSGSTLYFRGSRRSPGETAQRFLLPTLAGTNDLSSRLQLAGR